MPKYFCDYCDTHLTHDSPSVRKTHNGGRKHKDNVRLYYMNWLEEQAQSMISQTTAAFKAQQGLMAPPGAFMAAGIPPPGMMPPPLRPGMPPPMIPGMRPPGAILPPTSGVPPFPAGMLQPPAVAVAAGGLQPPATTEGVAGTQQTAIAAPPGVSTTATSSST